MNSVLVDLTSKIGFHKSMRGVSDFTQNSICQEEIFRYLLQAEQKRSKRSGHNYYVLLVYRIDDEGIVVRMDSYVASEILDALARSLRETDYVGWYREGYVAGGVLTVVGPDSVEDVHEHVQRRLKEIIQHNVGKESGSFQVKLCRQHELRGVEVFGEKAATVQ
jgi:hypothetical protein